MSSCGQTQPKYCFRQSKPPHADSRHTDCHFSGGSLRTFCGHHKLFVTFFGLVLRGFWGMERTHCPSGGPVSLGCDLQGYLARWDISAGIHETVRIQSFYWLRRKKIHNNPTYVTIYSQSCHFEDTFLACVYVLKLMWAHQFLQCGLWEVCTPSICTFVTTNIHQTHSDRLSKPVPLLPEWFQIGMNI